MIALLTMVGSFFLFVFVCFCLATGAFLSSDAGFAFTAAFNHLPTIISWIIWSPVILFVMVFALWLTIVILSFIAGLVHNRVIAVILQLAVGVFPAYSVWQNWGGGTGIGLPIALLFYLITVGVTWCITFAAYRSVDHAAIGGKR